MEDRFLYTSSRFIAAMNINHTNTFIILLRRTLSLHNYLSIYYPSHHANHWQGSKTDGFETALKNVMEKDAAVELIIDRLISLHDIQYRYAELLRQATEDSVQELS